jgi:hypothetical protein
MFDANGYYIGFFVCQVHSACAYANKLGYILIAANLALGIGIVPL